MKLSILLIILCQNYYPEIQGKITAQIVQSVKVYDYLPDKADVSKQQLKE